MDIANINKFRDNTVETDQIIGVYDLFESPHYLYLRLYKGDAIFIQRFDKKTGELKSQRIPDDYLECSAAIPGGNVIGMDNDIDGGIPFWPEYVMADGGRAQVVNADILLALREKGYLKQAPDVLNIGDEANPVVILYTFKDRRYYEIIYILHFISPCVGFSTICSEECSCRHAEFGKGCYTKS